MDMVSFMTGKIGIVRIDFLGNFTAVLSLLECAFVIDATIHHA